MTYTPRWKQILFAIFSPLSWVRLHPYSKSWDIKIQELIKGHEFGWDGRLISDNGLPFRVVFDNDVLIWIQNYPYACGYSDRVGRKVLPSRHTVYLLKKHVIDKIPVVDAAI